MGAVEHRARAAALEILVAIAEANQRKGNPATQKPKGPAAPAPQWTPRVGAQPMVSAM